MSTILYCIFSVLLFLFPLVECKSLSTSPAEGIWYLNRNISSTNIFSVLSILGDENGLSGSFVEDGNQFNVSFILFYF